MTALLLVALVIAALAVAGVALWLIKRMDDNDTSGRTPMEVQARTRTRFSVTSPKTPVGDPAEHFADARKVSLSRPDAIDRAPLEIPVKTREAERLIGEPRSHEAPRLARRIGE